MEIGLEKLKAIAQKHTWGDEIDGGEIIVDDFAGGNIDDAYSGGYTSGRVDLAREILNDLGIEFTVEEE